MIDSFPNCDLISILEYIISDMLYLILDEN